jgi:hypothetical protein
MLMGMTIERPEAAARKEELGAVPTGPVTFPADLTGWTQQERLLNAVQRSAVRACGDSWLNLVSDESVGEHGDDLLVLICYCYLQGLYHSMDVVRRLDSDEHLASLRGTLCLRPEQIRGFRREHRRALTDCLTHTLVMLWRDRHPGSPVAEGSGGFLEDRINFRFLEPFYLQAQDRIDRAVIMDSMALDD